MDALIFQCPSTHRTFRSNFRATREELTKIPRTAVIQLRCEICKEHHTFVVAECTVED